MKKSDRVICPVCKKEFSYGYLRYGGHVCKETIQDYINKISKKIG